AARLFEECLPVFQRLGHAVGVSQAVGSYSVVLLRLGAFDRAATLLDETLDAFRPNLPMFELCQLHDLRGQVAYAQSDLRRASDLFAQALRFGREYDQQFLIVEDSVILQHLVGELAVVGCAGEPYPRHTPLLPCRRAPLLWPAQSGASPDRRVPGRLPRRARR